MRRRGLALIATALCTGAVLAQTPRDPTPQTPAQGTAVISGRVTVLANGKPSPVRRARVVAQHQGGRAQTTDSDADGRFRLTNLAAGPHAIQVEKAGFVPADPLSRPRPRTTVVEPTDGQTAGVEIVMVRGAAIEGRLVRDTGQPAANVVVSAVRLTYGPYGAQPSAVRQARTDDRGRFRVHTLPAGEYYVHAEPDPLDTLIRSVPGDPSPGMARTYYPGTARVAEARRVSVSIGEERTSVDFAITSVPTAVVAGRVVHSSGNKPGAISIRLQRVGAPPGEVRGILSPPPDGFEFSVVPPGDYWLVASSRAAPAGPVEFAAQRITVAGQPHKDLRMATAPGASCTGLVEVDSGGSIPPGTSVVAHQTEYELPLPAGVDPGAVARAPVDDTGRFNFGSLFGPRVLRLDRAPETWALTQVRLDGVEISDRPVDFKSSGSPCVLTVSVTTQTAVVTGTVEDERRQPVPHARVVVFPEDLKLRGPRSRYVKSIEAGSDGRFVVTGLLPERYVAVAVNYLDEGTWDDVETLARLQPLGTSRTLAASERTMMTLTMRSLR